MVKSEQEFWNLALMERMAMHREQYQKCHPKTKEKEQKTKEREQVYQDVLSVLDEAHKEALKRFIDALIADAAAEEELYYCAGLRDGIQLDWMVETIRDKNQI